MQLALQDKTYNWLLARYKLEDATCKMEHLRHNVKNIVIVPQMTNKPEEILYLPLKISNLNEPLSHL